jgi:hypothetical protein
VAYSRDRVYRSGPVRAVVNLRVNGDVDGPTEQPPGRMVAYWGERSRSEHARLAAESRRVCENVSPDECLVRASKVEPSGKAIAVYVAPG